MILCLILNGLDVISGVITAIIKGELSARKMYEGMLHKVGFLLLYLLVYVLDTFLPEYGFLPQINLEPTMICIVVAIEVTSITENICKINPDLTPDILKRIFKNIETDAEKDVK